MCGRFVQHWTLKSWNALWPAEWRAPDYAPRYNVTPGTPVLAVVHDAADQAVGGLVEWGMKTPQSFLINARAETVADRPTFRPMLQHGRAVVPMNGYYEWHQQTRQPYYIAGDEPWWALALYQRTAAGPRLVVMTRAAIEPLADLHPRMPVLADRSAAAAWLQRGRPEYHEVLEQLLASVPEVSVRAVSRRVNRANQDDPALIEAVGGAGGRDGSLI